MFDSDTVAPEGADISPADAARLHFEAGQVFTPSAPIDQEGLFAGRRSERMLIIETIGQRGQHAVMYGERGLGKTSIANMLTPWLESLGKTVIAPRVNCDGSDTFTRIWRKMLCEIQVSRQAKQMGFRTEELGDELSTVADDLSRSATPDDIRRLLTPLGHDSILVLIFDEFDRLKTLDLKQLFADTIKALSDHSVRVTVVVVGVAESVQGLIAGHQSIERALVQIQIKRMSRDVGQAAPRPRDLLQAHREARAESRACGGS